MKKNGYLLLMLLVGSLALGGCRSRGGNSNADDDEQSSQTDGDNQDGSQGGGQTDGDNQGGSQGGGQTDGGQDGGGDGDEQTGPGFDPSWIDEGYTYSESYPVDKIKSFAGSSSDVKAPASLTGGCYYKQFAADTTKNTAAYFEIIVDGKQADSYYESRKSESWGRDVSDIYSYGFIDPSLSYCLSFGHYYDDDYKEVAPTWFDYYKASDIYASSKKTTDTAWDTSDVDKYWAALAEVVPFVKLGEDYVVESNQTDNALFFYDWAIDDTILSGYTDALISAGYEKVEETDEEGNKSVYYEKDLVVFTLSIEVYWDASYGNCIDAYKVLNELDAWPTESINGWTENIAESIKVIPAYASSDEESKYKLDAYIQTPESESDDSGDDDFGDDWDDIDWDDFDWDSIDWDSLLSYGLVNRATDADEDDSEEAVIEDIEVLNIQVTKAHIADFAAYAQAIKDAGGQATYDEGDTKVSPSIKATLGKLVLDVIFVRDYIEETGGYSLSNGTFDMLVTFNKDAHEVPGIFPAMEKAEIKLGSEVDLSEGIELVDVDEEKLAWISDDDTVATVTDKGVVTGAGEGTAHITVFEDADGDEVVDSEELSAEIEVTVTDKAEFQEPAAMSAGTNASSCKVNNIDGIKVGTSSKVGEMTVVVPAGTERLEFYAVCWNGLDGLEVSVEGTNGLDDKVKVKADAGIKGNSPYTLSGDADDYACTLELGEAVSEETTLSFSAEARFVIWSPVAVGYK